jgi:hypothetical protein
VIISIEYDGNKLSAILAKVLTLASEATQRVILLIAPAAIQISIRI